MNFANEYALLFAVALPVVLIVGMQVALYVAGERSTLLFPGMATYPSVAPAIRAVDVTPPMETSAPVTAPSNDEVERIAA